MKNYHSIRFLAAILSCFWVVDSVAEPFLWGTAISEYQVSGAALCANSNWSAWEKSAPKGIIVEPSEDACQFWARYQQDIDRIKKDLPGINALRLSVEWCLVEPEKGTLDIEALKHYRAVVEAFVAANITPIITLHHFVNPSWFDAMGGFEHEENIIYFEQFCRVVFEYLGDLVPIWCTINEPNVYMLQGYLRGVFPPGKQNLLLAIKVLRNMLCAHTRVYHALKSMPHGQHAKIGLVHQHLIFKPLHAWNPLESLPSLLNHLITHPVIEFVKNKKFSIIPFSPYQYEAPANKPVTDFLGLNYYSHVIIGQQPPIIGTLEPTNLPDEVMTDMPYALSAESFYQTLTSLSNQLEVPILITECGLADARDDRRPLFFEQYLNALKKAMLDGANVIGFLYWSLLDNYEWDLGYAPKFGLYAVDRKNQERTLRPSAQKYIDFIASSRFYASS